MKSTKTKIQVIKNVSPCYRCSKVTSKPSKKCTMCHGEGTYVDNHYILTHGKFAIDMDNAGK